MPNRLAQSTSPYLLQHADNPVDWWPWGPEALAEAERRDVPLLISSGYSACHWCHVMAHESFEDPDVARLINDHFVPIKIDREERPDLDAIYMRATQALTGQGGWPMTVFATPQGHPFFAGTYFPPDARPGMPSFTQVIEALADAWTTRRTEVLTSASSIVGQLRAINEVARADEAPAVWPLLEQVSGDFDPVNGGWGRAPKFPAPLLIDALLVKGEAGTLDLAQRALEHMARGGIHDQLGGGFHRYSVDASWVVPHFEKMLYDNALLLGSFARGWRRTPSHQSVLRWLFERAARGIVGWMQREMVLDGGGFAASLDADSPDLTGALVEGIFYVWNRELLTDALGEDDGAWAAKVFHVTERGSFEHGLSTLQLVGTPDLARLDDVCATLLSIRDQRFLPARDDKVVASWNGWAISGLVTAAEVFGEESWLDMALAAAQALWDVHWDGASLKRTSRGGQPASVDGFAEDYGAVATAFATLAGALGDEEWLARAVRVLECALERFAADDGGFFDAAASGEFYDRPREIADNPTPSGTSSLIEALRTVGALAERADFGERADLAATTTWGTLQRSPLFAPSSLRDLLIVDDARRGLAPAVVVVVDDAEGAITPSTQAVWRMAPLGTMVVRGRTGGRFGELLVGRGVREPGEFPMPNPKLSAVPDDSDEHEDVALGGTAYVCRGTTCFAPASTVKEVRAALWQRC